MSTDLNRRPDHGDELARLRRIADDRPDRLDHVQTLQEIRRQAEAQPAPVVRLVPRVRRPALLVAASMAALAIASGGLWAAGAFDQAPTEAVLRPDGVVGPGQAPRPGNSLAPDGGDSARPQVVTAAYVVNQARRLITDPGRIMQVAYRQGEAWQHIVATTDATRLHILPDAYGKEDSFTRTGDSVTWVHVEHQLGFWFEQSNADVSMTSYFDAKQTASNLKSMLDAVSQAPPNFALVLGEEVVDSRRTLHVRIQTTQLDEQWPEAATIGSENLDSIDLWFDQQTLLPVRTVETFSSPCPDGEEGGGTGVSCQGAPPRQYDYTWLEAGEDALASLRADIPAGSKKVAPGEAKDLWARAAEREEYRIQPEPTPAFPEPTP